MVTRYEKARVTRSNEWQALLQLNFHNNFKSFTWCVTHNVQTPRTRQRYYTHLNRLAQAVDSFNSGKWKYIRLAEQRFVSTIYIYIFSLRLNFIWAGIVSNITAYIYIHTHTHDWIHNYTDSLTRLKQFYSSSYR